MRLVVDASAIGALIFNEDAARAVEARLQGASVCTPELLKSELASIALKKARKNPGRSAEFFGRLDEFLRHRSIQWHDVNHTDVAILASLTGLSAYDASYLWLAGWLEADLVTLDQRLAGAPA